MFRDILAPTHLVLIVIVALLVFGPSRLPELGSAVGKTFREFKDAVSKVSVNDEEKAKELKDHNQD